jgi:hypothetical protein
MKPSKIAALALCGVLILAAVAFLATNRGAPPVPAVSTPSAGVNAANTPGDAGAEQIIEITAKGGYTPRTSRAKAGAPLLLKIKTDGTYDCSAGLRIAAIGWSQTLNPTGEADIQIPAQKAGVTLVGVCSMGMYNFTITFE